jgi:hypothetical protein
MAAARAQILSLQVSRSACPPRRRSSCSSSLSVMVVLAKHVAVRTTKRFWVWRQTTVDPRVLKQLGVCVVAFVAVLCRLSAQ